MNSIYVRIGGASLCVTLMFSASSLAQQAPSPAAQGDQIEEIVVTAQRREENLQSVPIAITAATASELQQSAINNMEGLQEAVSGLVITREENGVTPSIRGIGSPTAQAGVEPSVSIYVDGVYYASADSGLFSFNNIDHIEVLKGPQGTLFGRNATGGVIQIITKDPQQTPSGTASVSYGNYNSGTGSFYGTTGITPTLAVDFAVYSTKQWDGWGTNFPTDEKNFADYELDLRTKALWTPTDNFSLRLTADYSADRQDITTGILPGSIGLNGLPGYVGFYNTESFSKDYSYGHYWGFSANATLELSDFRLVSISSYRNVNTNYTVDQDATPIEFILAEPDIDIDQTVTQEFQLQSIHHEKYSWIVGMFYMYDKSGLYPIDVNGLAVAPLEQLDIRTLTWLHSESGFAQSTFEVLPDTRLTLGIRYTHDHRKIAGTTGGILPDTVLDLTSSPSTQEADFSKTTYRIALDHNFTPDIMGYVSYNVGFKSGFYNTISYSAPVVQPETLDATEVGLKTEFFDRALRLNVAGYYYKYKDLQLPESEAGSTNYYNAGAATLKGVDLDFAVIPVRNLTFQGGVSYEHGRYTSFPNAVGYVPNPAGGNTVVSFDATGYPTAQTPQWTENITGNYKFYLPNGTLQPSLIFTHNSGYCWSAADCRVQQPAYSVVNGTLAWNAPNERWGVSLWAKNIFNREYYRWENEQEPNYEFLPAAPRTYGITFQSKF